MTSLMLHRCRTGVISLRGGGSLHQPPSEAYRRWVCASLFPHYLEKSGERARPCRSTCQQVEQRCPFFLPGDRYPSYPTQYAGEPTFLCLDPNIPETGGQLAKSSYGDGGCCFHHCGAAELCHTEQCFTNTSSSTTVVPVHHCEAEGGGGGTSRTPVFSACSSSSATNIMVHPPLGGATSGAVTPCKTLFINLLLHIIFLLVIGMMFGLGFT
ncbi:uncharacterized protein Mid1 [Periplaneta americana]|uniref:uncharacterized protein Mid1 n=1 Tax=Periplaneta americana TaxID=6978 RepID=UPI0037E967ED